MNVNLLFGMRVRALREQRALTQEEFAYRCGLDRTYISGGQRGKRNVCLKNIAAIAQALDVSLSTLFLGIEPDVN